MHYDFTITWSSIAALAGVIGVVWQVGKGVGAVVKAILDFLAFCKALVQQHEQMWRAHCNHYDLDVETGLPQQVQEP